MSDEILNLDGAGIRFASCVHRSVEKIKTVIQRCQCKGGPYEIEGYECKKRQIAQLQQEMCQDCPFYQSR